MTIERVSIIRGLPEAFRFARATALQISGGAMPFSRYTLTLGLPMLVGFWQPVIQRQLSLRHEQVFPR